VVEIVQETPDLASLEILRRVRESGYQGGKTALYALVASLRPKPGRPSKRTSGFTAGTVEFGAGRGGGKFGAHTSTCPKSCADGSYGEAVEKGFKFKVVRDRLRSLTSYETGSDAFGKGKLYSKGAAAPHVDDDFQNGVKFLTMAIDRFRNEKSPTADGNISDPVRAYEYPHLSSSGQAPLGRRNNPLNPSVKGYERFVV
jgi:hypothetical protein